MEKINLTEPYAITNREREVYRTLRTNIEFSGVENRVIAITSHTPSDGKSTVSYSLAVSFAENGKKVVLIDADLRKSVFSQRYQVTGEYKGLSHYLAGKNQVTDVIYATNKTNLYMIPTGVFPKNPTELLGNARMENLLSALKNTFDYVVIDTPPLGSVIDAAVIAKNSDASALVLSHEETSKKDARKMVDQLKAANPNFLGVILNKVRMKEGGYYYKRYGSYYGKRHYGYY